MNTVGTYRLKMSLHQKKKKNMAFMRSTHPSSSSSYASLRWVTSMIVVTWIVPVATILPILTTSLYPVLAFQPSPTPLPLWIAGRNVCRSFPVRSVMHVHFQHGGRRGNVILWMQSDPNTDPSQSHASSPLAPSLLKAENEKNDGRAKPPIQISSSSAGVDVPSPSKNDTDDPSISLYNAVPLFTGTVITILSLVLVVYGFYAGLTGDDPLTGHSKY